MPKQMNNMKKVDDGILQVKEIQQKVDQNAIIIQKAVQLISECRFDEAMKILAVK